MKHEEIFYAAFDKRGDIVAYIFGDTPQETMALVSDFLNIEVEILEHLGYTCRKVEVIVEEI